MQQCSVRCFKIKGQDVTSIENINNTKYSNNKRNDQDPAEESLRRGPSRAKLPQIAFEADLDDEVGSVQLYKLPPLP
jgi:hypothetical protein